TERHLARHLGVARFVVEEGGDVEVDGEQRARPESERQRGPASERERPRERDHTLFTDCHPGSLGDRWAKVNALAWSPPARQHSRTFLTGSESWKRWHEGRRGRGASRCWT